MLNVSGGRYDVLEVWDGTQYVNVAEALGSLAGLEGQIEADEARLEALEDKVGALEAKLESLDQVKSSSLHCCASSFSEDRWGLSTAAIR